jgi:hypothetical protein
VTGDDFPMRGKLLAMRIVHFALCLGLLAFAVIAFGLRQGGGMPPPPPVPIVSYVGYGFAALMFLLSMFVPNVIQTAWRKQVVAGKWPTTRGDGSPPNSEEGWWGLYQTRLIIQMALLEGAAFFQLIAYQVEGQQLSLGLGLGLLLCEAALFPTREGVERWVATQRDLVEQQRLSGG